MKRGHVYTFLFMVVITAVLVFALAAAYEGFKPSIQRNKQLQEQRAVLSALGLDEGLKDNQIAAVYEEKIKPGKLNGFEEAYGMPVLAHIENGETLAYAVPIEGSGLWGALRGYLGVNADRTQTTGLVFTYQNETPGLGGRIDEDWFKNQFRSLPITPNTLMAYGSVEDKDIDAITGATQTSSAVMRTINKSLTEIVFSEEVK